MADQNYNDTADTTNYDNADHEARPNHGIDGNNAGDATKGGILGAVGGGIVGALAGGPVGAVIGAVVGGAASAGGVAAVDRHDHDSSANETGTTDNNVDNRDTSARFIGNDENPADYRASSDTTAPVYDNSMVMDSSTTRTGDYAGTTGSTAYDTNSSASNSAVDMSSPRTQDYTFDDNRLDDRNRMDNQDQTVIPVVEEQLQVGKRAVETGGARITSHVEQTPIEQNVNLREEHVTVDRRPVDRPIDNMDMNQAFRDNTIEMTEMAEEPVVAKQARVVEEVVVGKTATERNETVRDTVRRTDVDVEKIDGSNDAGMYNDGRMSNRPVDATVNVDDSDYEGSDVANTGYANRNTSYDDNMVNDTTRSTR